MSNRHLSRTIALQTLFEWDFHHRSKKLFDLLKSNIVNFAPVFEDNNFTEGLVKGVTKHLKDIDALIQKFAPEWPIDQITVIDRNILRLGIFELKYDNQMPPRVAINEAIELAKAFGGESSYRFVNGVLGAIYKDMGEPEKNITTPITAEPQEISVGGVVYRRTKDGLVFAVIKDAINKWTFPKGKIGDLEEHKDEDILTALRREITEELGIKTMDIKLELGSIDVTVRPPNKDPYPKRIHYYLVETKEETLVPEESVTVKDAEWVTQDNMLEKLGYDNSKELFNYALTKIDTK